MFEHTYRLVRSRHMALADGSPQGLCHGRCCVFGEAAVCCDGAVSAFGLSSGRGSCEWRLPTFAEPQLAFSLGRLARDRANSYAGLTDVLLGDAAPRNRATISGT